MSNGTYQRTTSASRRAARTVKYKFVSKRVGRDEKLAPVMEIKGRVYRAPPKLNRLERKEAKRAQRWLNS